MLEVRVYDDARNQVWREALAPGEVAVFHVDAATGRHRSAHGTRLANHRARTCLVFPSLDDAVAYAEPLVQSTPDVAGQLFAATATEPIAVV